MLRVRCPLCRGRLATIKYLKTHLIKHHSKGNIVKQLLKKSAIQATPKIMNRGKRTQIIYLQEKIKVSCTKDTLFIQDDSSCDNVMEFTFENIQDHALQDSTNVKTIQRNKKTVSKTCKKRQKKELRKFRIGIKKIKNHSFSLDEQTGEFYECHCREQSSDSGTDSSLDTSKSFICECCGSGFATSEELAVHDDTHVYLCRICDKFFNFIGYRQHIREQHLVRIFACHLCGVEFVCKDVLMAHLGYHYEQQTLENVLNMERDYDIYDFPNVNYNGGDYFSNITNILMYLTYPYDHYYTRNMFMTVFCDICCEEFFTFEYDRHLKMAHLPN